MDFTARRIVSLQPSASVILSSIGALDRLVGCTKYCEEVIPGISEGRFIVADSWTSKADEILAARPDLVIAGGELVGEPGKQTTGEAVQAIDPEILIAAWCGAGDRVPLEKIIRDRGWSEMRAVRERQVYCIPDAFLNTPAPTLIEGLRAIAGIVYPPSGGDLSGLRRIGQAPVSRLATK